MCPVDDLLLTINKLEQRYVVSDRHGGSLSEFDDSQIGTLASGGKDVDSSDGRHLYDLLFSSYTPVAPSESSLRRLIFKLIHSDELAELPWEVLHDGAVFLGLSSLTAIVRLHSPALGTTSSLLITATTKRMLITVASDMPTEVEALCSICAQFGIEVVILSDPTRGRIFTKLQEAEARGQPFSLWHHSGTVEMRGESLSLTLPKGDNLSIEQLNRALKRSGGIKVLTLNLSGADRGAAPFYQINVPLLLTSTRTLDPLAAQTCFQTFYSTVWRDGVARAVLKARLAMSDVDFGTHDWATLLHFQTTQTDRLIPDVEEGPVMTQRNQLFISYSHQDTPWLQKLQPYLNALALHFKIVIWDDRDLTAGQRWHDAIMAALNRSKVVLILASVHYFGSSYIAQHELPTILKGTANGDVKLLWAPVSSYSYNITPLKDYQAVFDPKIPLDRRGEQAQQDALLAISDAILQTMNSAIPPSSTP